MAKLIAVLLSALAAAFPAVAKAHPPAVPEGKIILFDRTYSDLPTEYRKPIELAFAFDRWINSHYETTIENPFSIALIDLNDDGAQEVIIRFDHVFHGMVNIATVLVARKTEVGWRFIGEIEAPLFREHDTIPPILVGDTQFFVEEKKVRGWRIINNGPRFVYKHLYGETDDMGGLRYCWTKIAPPSAYRYDKFHIRGLPFDSGGPGYFSIVEAAEPCPER